MLQNIIKNRRSVYPHMFNDKPVSKEDIEKILASANWAPTHKKTEPWRFKVIYEEAKREEFGDFMAKKYKETAKKFSERKYKKTRDKFLQSSCVILICMQRDAKERIPHWEEVASTAMAVQNMWLTAADMEIGSYWSSPGLIKYMGEKVDFKEGEECLGLFYIGNYDMKIPEGQRQPISEKVEWL